MIQQRARTFGRHLDAELDRRGAQAASAPTAGDDTVFNNSESEMKPRRLYGMSAGIVAMALAGAGDSILALWVPARPGSPGQNVPIRSGQALILIESGQTPTAGGIAWLSAATPGAVTATVPAASDRQHVGTFASSRLTDDAYALVNLSIDPQVSGS